jgi:hypothetical protein
MYRDQTVWSLMLSTVLVPLVKLNKETGKSHARTHLPTPRTRSLPSPSPSSYVALFTFPSFEQSLHNLNMLRLLPTTFRRPFEGLHCTDFIWLHWTRCNTREIFTRAVNRAFGKEFKNWLLNNILDRWSETTTASSSSRQFRFATHMFVLDVIWVIRERMKFDLVKKRKKHWWPLTTVTHNWAIRSQFPFPVPWPYPHTSFLFFS